MNINGIECPLPLSLGLPDFEKVGEILLDMSPEGNGLRLIVILDPHEHFLFYRHAQFNKVGMKLMEHLTTAARARKIDPVGLHYAYSEFTFMTADKEIAVIPV